MKLPPCGSNGCPPLLPKSEVMSGCGTSGVRATGPTFVDAPFTVAVTVQLYGVFHCISAAGTVQYGTDRVPEVITLAGQVWPGSGLQVMLKL